MRDEPEGGARGARVVGQEELARGVRWGFGAGENLADHVGPAGDAAAARSGLAAGLGVPADRLLVARQVHGGGAVTVDGPWPGGPCEADALVTDTPGLVLAVLVADCVPVLLADPGAGVVAVAHAGRRGMDLGVVAEAVAAMGRLGARPGRTRARLGPSVCARCYEVPAAMRDDVAGRHPVTASRTWRGTPALDVAAGVLEQLATLGVVAEQVPGCTVEDPAWGSVRRDGPGAPRWAGLVWRQAR